MPVVTFADFSGGLDVRPQQFLARPNILRILQNAYVTTGKTVKKRPCLMAVATLEAGTVGLKSFKGKLQTFYGEGAAIVHANPLFTANRVPHWTTGATRRRSTTPISTTRSSTWWPSSRAPVYRHYYLDDPGAWVTADGLRGEYRRADGGERLSLQGDRWGGPEQRRRGAGVADDVGARWSTTGALTWTCQAFDITDANCPHTKPVMKQSQKMFAAGTDGTTVRFCKTGDPRDWTTANDAGFLPVGLYARGSDQVTALGLYGNKNIAVFFSDNSQLWLTDPNPANMSLTWNIEGVGTLFAKASGPVSHDLFFLAQTGFRSASVQQLTNNVQEADIGSAIDALVRADIASTDDPISIYYPKLGQFWSIQRQPGVGVLLQPRLEDLRLVEVHLPLLDRRRLRAESGALRAHGQRRLQGHRRGDEGRRVLDPARRHADVPAGRQAAGRAQAVHRLRLHRHRQPDGELPVHRPGHADDPRDGGLRVPGGDRAREPLPGGADGTRIAPHFQHQKDESFEVGAAMLHYENLGVIG
jgi:hypothetical protein